MAETSLAKCTASFMVRHLATWWRESSDSGAVARVAWTSQQHPARTRSRWSTHVCREKDNLARAHLSGTISNFWSLLYSDPMRSSWPRRRAGVSHGLAHRHHNHDRMASDPCSRAETKGFPPILGCSIDLDRPNPPHPDHSDHQDQVQLSHHLHPWASWCLFPIGSMMICLWRCSGNISTVKVIIIKNVLTCIIPFFNINLNRKASHSLWFLLIWVHDADIVLISNTSLRINWTPLSGLNSLVLGSENALLYITTSSRQCAPQPS